MLPDTLRGPVNHSSSQFYHPTEKQLSFINQQIQRVQGQTSKSYANSILLNKTQKINNMKSKLQQLKYAMKKVNNIVKYGNYSVSNIIMQLSGLDPALKTALKSKEELMMYKSKPQQL